MHLRLFRAFLAAVCIASAGVAASKLLGQVPGPGDQVAVSGTAVTTGSANNRPINTGATVATSVSADSEADYEVVAYKPQNPKDVRVSVSLSKQQVYVMEGERCLMAAACNIGVPAKPTPKGHFKIMEKIPNKRSGTYGFQVSNGKITPCLAATCHGVYVGYPLPFWCGFAPGYGFHQGYVWPAPRTHGLIRLDKQAAPRFFELVQTGTPVDIADTQPEDATVGQNVQRPTDYQDPDLPPEFMVGPGPFQRPPGTLLIDQ